MTIGVIFCAWQAEDLLPTSLAPWIEARAAGLAGHRFIVCGVSVPFESFPNEEPRDKTRSILGGALQGSQIDHAIVRDKPMKETEARGAALRWLIEQGADTLIQVDADEFYTVEEIKRIFVFVERNPLVPTFRGSFKNYVFDDRTYLTEPFNPMRIHRVRAGGYRVDSFHDDNNATYRSVQFPDHSKRDTDFSCLTIPRTVAWTRHVTWPNSPRSKAKCEYQWARWGRSSFSWSETEGLIWTPGQLVPETARD